MILDETFVGRAVPSMIDGEGVACSLSIDTPFVGFGSSFSDSVGVGLPFAVGGSDGRPLWTDCTPASMVTLPLIASTADVSFRLSCCRDLIPARTSFSRPWRSAEEAGTCTEAIVVVVRVSKKMLT